ncbi:MAG TPA: bifunctional oligoribonuclease/PAP phosphatase NrnA [Candidatus Heimdallarchaeota archaeon]|nr:bifunctional oligoribonuclease/PAP phosphatase NrnA [Candidatus Heimdallarchaeota archaeon]
MKDPVDSISQKIHESQSIAITSHLRPDGDSICTGLALYFMGKSLGKNVALVNKDNTPVPFNNFPDIENITIGQIPPSNYDIIILLECANVSRSGQVHLDDAFKINIDHHHSNDYYGDINWVDPEAPAVACLAYTLGEKLSIEFTPRISNLLYCAIVSDTGSFQFSNTKAQSFEVSYKLIKHGANPIKMSEMLFNNNSPEKIKLLGQVLSTLTMNEKGNIAIITMFKKNLEDLNLREIDTEDITTLARSIKDVEMVLFFKEMEKDTYRVSLRSKGNANSAMVAEHFGGGGHLHAAGFTALGNYEQLLRDIPQTVEKLIKSNPDNPST